MTSILAAQPSDMKSSLPFARSKPTMPEFQDQPDPRHGIKQEAGGHGPQLDDDRARGRPRSRSRSNDKNAAGLDIDDAADADADGNHANSSNSDGPARKRRRSRKGLDKKFECPQKDCGKSYSRAEHLYEDSSRVHYLFSCRMYH